MNKKMLLFAACLLVLVACEKKGNESVSSDKETALKEAVTPYVSNTVIATYSHMADEGLVLHEQCQQILAGPWISMP